MHCLREAIPHYHKSTPTIVSKKSWNIKEDKGKSMMHALYSTSCGWKKTHLGTKQC